MAASLAMTSRVGGRRMLVATSTAIEVTSLRRRDMGAVSFGSNARRAQQGVRWGGLLAWRPGVAVGGVTLARRGR